MFLLFSIPGVLLAAVMWFAMPSPTKNVLPEHAVGSHSAGWLWLLKRPASWLLFTGHLTFNVGFWGFLGWMPGYLAIQRHLDIKALGVAASVPYVCGFVGILVLGWLDSHALYRFRAQLVAAGYLCAAASLYVARTRRTTFKSVWPVDAAQPSSCTEGSVLTLRLFWILHRAASEPRSLGSSTRAANWAELSLQLSWATKSVPMDHLMVASILWSAPWRLPRHATLVSAIAIRRKEGERAIPGAGVTP
jgi:hypothetical protein